MAQNVRGSRQIVHISHHACVGLGILAGAIVYRALRLPACHKKFVASASTSFPSHLQFLRQNYTLLMTIKDCQCPDRFRAVRRQISTHGWAPEFEGSFRFRGELGNQQRLHAKSDLMLDAFSNLHQA